MVGRAGALRTCPSRTLLFLLHCIQVVDPPRQPVGMSSVNHTGVLHDTNKNNVQSLGKSSVLLSKGLPHLDQS